eukprot:CAMPEP_0174733466 /NCGR_PEP_ID=MMETSP1094-20130205/61383_1 /TAXON_ID=156173 /ORGANISM="Chrysochromulina brevifilum, Strain UTEX LB 985" /LENGTH=199 /DNA_ID=CAMNT_0015936125 /DNA_START=249 /DNA_END=847 /DNA_ORIENTATION=+
MPLMLHTPKSFVALSCSSSLQFPGSVATQHDHQGCSVNNVISTQLSDLQNEHVRSASSVDPLDTALSMPIEKTVKMSNAAKHDNLLTAVEPATQTAVQALMKRPTPSAHESPPYHCLNASGRIISRLGDGACEASAAAHHLIAEPMPLLDPRLTLASERSRLDFFWHLGISVVRVDDSRTDAYLRQHERRDRSTREVSP